MFINNAMAGSFLNWSCVKCLGLPSPLCAGVASLFKIARKIIRMAEKWNCTERWIVSRFNVIEFGLQWTQETLSPYWSTLLLLMLLIMLAYNVESSKEFLETVFDSAQVSDENHYYQSFTWLILPLIKFKAVTFYSEKSVRIWNLNGEFGWRAVLSVKICLDLNLRKFHILKFYQLIPKKY